MNNRTATIIGSTGMIGSYLQAQLLLDNDYDYVRILVRRPMPVTMDKLEVKLVNFSEPESVMLAIDGSDVVFSCIGTTTKNVNGNKSLYWKIDHDIPVNACKYALETGCKKFIIVSSAGANEHSHNFYLKMKGQTEKDLIATGIPELHIMRPGLLLGNRKEKRPMEKFMQGLMKYTSGLMLGGARKYRAVKGGDLAKAMIAASKVNQPGVHIYHYN
ncbi:MAG: NAD(P)H-binding protein, partial [Niabella sp.]